MGANGFDRALQRLIAIEKESDGTTAVVSAIECVVWSTTVVDLLAPTRSDLDSFALAPRELELLDGLRWARNQGVHRLVSSIEAAVGVVHDRVYPRQYWHWAWALRSELEIRHGLRPAPRLERAYDSALGGQQAIPTLRHAGEIIERLIAERAGNSEIA